MRIISNNLIALDTYELVLEGDFDYEVTPGQFMHIKTGRIDQILRRPISIAHYENRKFYLVYKVVGEGTKELSILKPDTKVDVLGPLGSGFKIQEHNNVLIVGGGMGVAPLYQLALKLKENNTKLTFVFGYGSEEMIYYHDDFSKLGTVHYTTDDGSFGVRGNVSAVIETLPNFDTVYACGPLPLLKYLQRKYTDHDHLYISLEERMACGIGACYACDTKDKKHRVCCDGPVFNAKEVEL